MILYQTTQQEKDAFIPSKLDFGNILLARHKNLSSKIRRGISLTEIGNKGESHVVKILKEFGSKHWIYLQNVWLDKNGRYESDIIVITNVGIYIFEVKNYEGNFVYDNGDCKINNYDLTENCIAQTNRAYKKMQSICSDTFIKAKTHGAIIFIGEYNPVEIKSPISNIKVVKRSGLKSYIQQMIEEERNFHERQIDIDSLMQQLNKYCIPDPFRFNPLSDEEFTNIRTGICCSRCQNFSLDITGEHYFRCECGMEESLEEAVIRTICEYGSLRYDKNLVVTKLLDFINHQTSLSNLYRILNKHFARINPKSRSGYHNKKLTLERISDDFKIVKPRKLYLHKNSLIVYMNNQEVIIDYSK